jgi:hypothetical protein
MGTSVAWASCTLIPGLVQTQWDTLITRPTQPVQSKLGNGNRGRDDERR